jgi:hypothetical protein
VTEFGWIAAMEFNPPKLRLVLADKPHSQPSAKVVRFRFGKHFGGRESMALPSERLFKRSHSRFEGVKLHKTPPPRHHVFLRISCGSEGSEYFPEGSEP